jgi:hypothetical protein
MYTKQRRRRDDIYLISAKIGQIIGIIGSLPSQPNLSASLPIRTGGKHKRFSDKD